MTDRFRVAAVIVSDRGWGVPDARARQDRLGLADPIALRRQADGASIIVLPAGYLMTDSSSESGAQQLARSLYDRFTRLDMAVAGGVDLPEAQLLRLIQDPYEKGGI